MDESYLRFDSAPSVENGDNNLKDNILKKFTFLRSFKDYVVSKIRSHKYQVNKGSNHEISIISYDQSSFTEAEEKLDLEVASSRIDPKILQTLKKVLFSKIGKHNSFTDTDKELLEIVEKTFARQLDIFEALLKLIESKNYESEKVNTLQTQLNIMPLNDKSMDGFVNDIIKNLVNELTKPGPSREGTSVEAPKEVGFSNSNHNLGDNVKNKATNVSCECQKPTASGAAVFKARYDV